MRLLLIFIVISFSGNSQNSNSVYITPTTKINLDSSASYIYCATMEVMWNELSQYLGEKPKSPIENFTIELLNESISKNYQSPIEDDYVVANSGLVKDSIINKINSELERKFNISWYPSNLPENALISYSYLKKDVKFYHDLDDDFYNQPFNGASIINVDYFGVKEGDPNRSRKDLIVYDFKSADDFIVQIKCRDSLDEVYLAKIPMQPTLLASYQNVLERVSLDNMELFNGGDILKIPYIKFDTTTAYTDIEGTALTNEILDGKVFQSVEQRISFDLNQQGIKLESSAVSIIDFADFENPPPRVLAFDKPFLIIMKRKNSDLPYFMYWVSGTEFMRSYILKSRILDDHEAPLIGTWKITEKILSNGDMQTFSGTGQTYTFKSDGTFEFIRQGYDNKLGTWKYSDKVISINWLDSNFGSDFDIEWILDEFTSEKFIIGGKTKLIFKKE